jgi:hypothetical protein
MPKSDRTLSTAHIAQVHPNARNLHPAPIPATGTEVHTETFVSTRDGDLIVLRCHCDNGISHPFMGDDEESVITDLIWG